MRYTHVLYESVSVYLSSCHILTALLSSKRTTPYLPAFQVWTSDHPHPQRDVYKNVCVFNLKTLVFLSLSTVFRVALVSGESNEGK